MRVALGVVWHVSCVCPPGFTHARLHIRVESSRYVVCDLSADMAGMFVVLFSLSASVRHRLTFHLPPLPQVPAQPTFGDAPPPPKGYKHFVVSKEGPVHDSQLKRQLDEDLKDCCY